MAIASGIWGRMDTGQKISGVAHLGLITWVMVFDLFQAPDTSLTIPVADVSIISAEDFAALSGQAPAAPAPEPITPEPAIPEAPEPAPAPEADLTAPDPIVPPAPEPEAEPAPPPEPTPSPAPPASSGWKSANSMP